MWEYYSGKILFITGASGFLGTALVYRIISQATVAHLYLLCRGGLPRLEEIWRQYLPSGYIECLHDTEFVTVIPGDIIEPSIGIDEDHIQALQERVDIVIHAASSINITSSLVEIARPVIQGSENVSQFALQCHRLDRFVYVSTAYANAFLYQESDDTDPYVEETVYPLGRGWTSGVRDEWNQVHRQGNSLEHNAHNFPSSYSYAKHLTERLVLHRFTAAGKAETILIIRPSLIAPAQVFPYPGFSVPKSTPMTVLTARLILTPPSVVRLASRANNPETETTIDEVPIDVVVDRLLVHLAGGTTGPVHAVSGTRARYPVQTHWEQAMALRKFPKSLRMEWLDVDWRSSSLHPIAQMYVLYGTSYRFSEAKTISLAKSLTKKESLELQLFTSGRGNKMDLAARAEQIRLLVEQFAAKRPLSRI
ncbi:male sterility protein-domain-containing protein [Aspergillus bertholletiae]|uniref:Fatty acyl-CoA reductase n=1 Tax=Aspergillus bertholletiae TaxID=1226010 RepID=A0A5N7B3H8_9EURO|nr:male sterility protein-domain-containing protein [Aspergillus bertholletiae]